MDWFFTGSLFYLLLPASIAVVVVKIISAGRREKALLAQIQSIRKTYTKVRAVVEDIGFDVDWHFPGRSLPDGENSEVITGELAKRQERSAREMGNVLQYIFVFNGVQVTSDRIAVVQHPGVRLWLLARRPGEQIIAWVNPEDPADCYVFLNADVSHVWSDIFQSIAIAALVALVSIVGIFG